MKTITKGQVATLLSPSQIAINRGSNQGVALDDTVRIMNPVQVMDPESHESLGEVLFPVLVLKVNYVSEKLATAYVTQRVSPNVTANAYFRTNPFLNPNQTMKMTASENEVDSQTVLITIGQTVLVERPDEKLAT